MSSSRISHIQIIEAYRSGDFQQAYELAVQRLRIGPDLNYQGESLIYCGLSVGFLSTLQKPRLTEMVDYIGKGIKLGVGSVDSQEIALGITSATNGLTSEIISYYLRIIKGIRDQKSQSVIVPTQGKSISENIGAGLGAGIGAGIANSIIRNEEANKHCEQLAQIYETAYQGVSIRALNYGWETNKSVPVAIIINDTISKIFAAKCFLPSYKSIFRIQVSSLLKELDDRYPNLTRSVF
ncbi:MAG: hypothetical protein H8D23_27280 [Candidatus Brocadiales bacterium]|nr:hypothetical protein [Candidatus Brocadiales bacterium]